MAEEFDARSFDDGGVEDRDGVKAVRYIEAAQEAVWDAWTEASQLATWWWPMFDDARYEIDLQEGGVYRFSSSSGGVGVLGGFIEVDAPNRLIFSWNWQSGHDDVEHRLETVGVSFEPSGKHTVVTVTQTAPIDDVDAVQEGWEDSLTRLEEKFLDEE